MKSGTPVLMKDGSLRVIDPDRSTLPMLKKLDPGFEVVVPGRVCDQG